MGLIDKIYKVAKTADIMQRLSGSLDMGNLTKGLNLNSFDVNNLGSIGSDIESLISSKVSEVTGGIENSVDVSQIQNIAADIKPEDVGIDLSSIDTGGMDLNSLGIDLNGLSFF